MRFEDQSRWFIAPLGLGQVSVDHFLFGNLTRVRSSGHEPRRALGSGAWRLRSSLAAMSSCALSPPRSSITFQHRGMGSQGDMELGMRAHIEIPRTFGATIAGFRHGGVLVRMRPVLSRPDRRPLAGRLSTSRTNFRKRVDALVRAPCHCTSSFRLIFRCGSKFSMLKLALKANDEADGCRNGRAGGTYFRATNF